MQKKPLILAKPRYGISKYFRGKNVKKFLRLGIHGKLCSKPYILPHIKSSKDFFHWFFEIEHSFCFISNGPTKDHSFCRQCLHDLQFMKTRSSSPNLSKLARADISYQFMKTRSLCRTVYKMNGLYHLHVFDNISFYIS